MPAAKPVSPRPPNVAPTSEPQDPLEPSSPALNDTSSGMSAIAMEAALAEMTAWRRDAERKIAQLEAEVLQLRATQAFHALHAGPPTLDLSAVTAVNASPLPKQPVKEPLPPWAVGAPAAHVAPVMAPAPVAQVRPASPAPPQVQAYTPAPAQLAPTPVAPPAAPTPIAPSVVPYVDAQFAPPTVAPSPPQVYSIQPRQAAPSYSQVPQYDLEMKPGDSFDMPTGLDGSRRKRRLVGFVVMVIVTGMAAMIIAALASQR